MSHSTESDNSNSYSDTNVVYTNQYSSDSQGSSGHNNRGGGGYGGGHGSGRGGRSSVQCQVCFKYNHTALTYYNRFNPQYQVANSDNNNNYGNNTNHNQNNNWNNRSSNQNWGQNQNQNSNWNNSSSNWSSQQSQNQKHNSQSSNSRPPQAMVANSDSNASSSWFPDSGASFHVTNNSQNIQQTSPFEGADQIFIGNGKGLNISASGHSKFVSPLSPNVKLVLKNMLLVPQITKNLISVSLQRIIMFSLNFMPIVALLNLRIPIGSFYKEMLDQMDYISFQIFNSALLCLLQLVLILFLQLHVIALCLILCIFGPLG